jgi:hypothetical protein
MRLASRSHLLVIVGALVFVACNRPAGSAPASADAGPPVVELGPEPAVGVDAGTPPLRPLAPPGQPPPAHAHGGSGCAGNLVPVIVAPGAPAECVLECASDPSCPEGMICDAHAALAENGKPGKTVGYCTMGKRAPGAKVGAGPTPAPSAAHAPSAAPAPTVTAAPKRLDVRKEASGVCPVGYQTCGAACRLTCKANTDCGLATARCVQGTCEGPGALPCK